MSEPIGRIVLRESARYLREHPNVWTKGYGSLEVLATGRNVTKTKSALNGGRDTGCILTILRAHCLVIAGPNYKDRAMRQAVEFLCNAHRIKAEESSIFLFNDSICSGTREAVEFIEAAAVPKPMRPTGVPKSEMVLA